MHVIGEWIGTTQTFELDASGRVRSWPLGMEALVGVPKDMALGRRIDELSDGVEGFGWSEVLARLPEVGRWQCVARWAGREAACPWLSVGAEALLPGSLGESTGWRVWLRALDPPQRLGERPLRVDPGPRQAVEPWAARAASHDLASIFMAIECFAGLLAPELPGDGRAREVLGHLVGATRRGSELAREALDSGRSRVDALQPVHPAAVLYDLLPILRALLGPGLELHVDMDGALPTVLSSHRHFEAILLNLVANARDALDGNGRIDIRLVRVDAGGVQGVRLTVTDTGAGIPQGAFERIFEPFFTTKSKERGTGLGLPMVLEAVRAAGGRLEFTSHDGKGTSIDVWFEAFELRSVAPARSRWSEGGSARPSVLLSLVPGSLLARPLEILLRRSGFDVVVQQDPDPLQVRWSDRRYAAVLVELPPAEGLADECPKGTVGSETVYLRAASAGAWACGGTVLDLPCDPREILQTVHRLVSRSDHEYAFGPH